LIEDRHGTPLAISSPVVSLWANPQQLKDSPRLAELAALAWSRRGGIKRQARFVRQQALHVFGEASSTDFARQILQEAFPGVRGERAYRRYYPAGEVTAQVLGLTNVDGEGIAGIELAFEQWLQGIPGKKRLSKIFMVRQSVISA
jgi:cell division protein FtsI (penicillin-binding protein 3)